VSVTVITTPGNVYLVENGRSFETTTTVTGELYVRVYSNENYENVIAAFGSVEAVYSGAEVKDVTDKEDEPDPKRPISL
jgi:hypothetical protein